MLFELAALPIHRVGTHQSAGSSESTPLANVEKLDVIDWIRTIAVARIIMRRVISACRQVVIYSDSDQALAFIAGANSLFSGDKLLTARTVVKVRNKALFAKLGLKS